MATSASQVPAPSSGASTPAESPGQPPAGVFPGDDLLSKGEEGGQPQPPPVEPKQAAADASEQDLGTEWLERWVERAHAGIDRLAELAAPRLQRLQDGVGATGDSLRRRAGQAREEGEEWAQSLRCTVREHPMTAVALAAALGLLIARASR